MRFYYRVAAEIFYYHLALGWVDKDALEVVVTNFTNDDTLLADGQETAFHGRDLD